MRSDKLFFISVCRKHEDWDFIGEDFELERQRGLKRESLEEMRIKSVGATTGRRNERREAGLPFARLFSLVLASDGAQLHARLRGL